jgi:hypothetical protein
MKILISLFILISFHSAYALRVYKYDGTTLLGNDAKCMISPCDAYGYGWAYSDVTTGAVTILTLVAVPNTIYYQGSGCTGQALSFATGITTDGVASYSQTGSFSWTGYSSYRTYGGACVESISANNLNASVLIATPPCGHGPCKIKP